MKLSQTLYKQSLSWHFKKFWVAQSKMKVVDTGAERILREKGVSLVRGEDYLVEKRAVEARGPRVEVVGYKQKVAPLDETHPNWHDQTLLTFLDNNVLLEGLTQAKILTNTVEIQSGLPESLKLNSTKKIDDRVKEIIEGAHIFDAEQKKLPKIKDPERPAFNFPRVLGISQPRATKLLLTNLLQLIETNSEACLAKQRSLIDDLLFSYHFEKAGAPLQFQLKGDSLLTSNKPLSPITNEKTDAFELPDIYPIKPTITLNEENIYEIRHIYPINLKRVKSHPHTVFVHHNEEEVRNIFEEPVTEPQIQGNSLMKTFTVAASYARANFGHKVKNLPKPVTVQCVQTNGRVFHFGIFQLNSLDLENGTRNVWYNSEMIPLFEKCKYEAGRPILEGYNNQVVKYLNAFYNNV